MRLWGRLELWRGKGWRSGLVIMLFDDREVRVRGGTVWGRALLRGW